MEPGRGRAFQEQEVRDNVVRRKEQAQQLQSIEVKPEVVADGS